MRINAHFLCRPTPIKVDSFSESFTMFNSTFHLVGLELTDANEGGGFQGSCRPTLVRGRGPIYSPHGVSWGSILQHSVG